MVPNMDRRHAAIRWGSRLFSLAVFIALRVGIRQPPNLRVWVDGAHLNVRFERWDVLWTLRRGLTASLDQVETISAVPLASVPHEGARLPGTYIPGVIRAGSYGIGARRDLWDVRCAERVLVVGLRPGAPYRRLVLQVAGVDDEAARLRLAVGTSAGR